MQLKELRTGNEPDEDESEMPIHKRQQQPRVIVQQPPIAGCAIEIESDDLTAYVACQNLEEAKQALLFVKLLHTKQLKLNPANGSYEFV